MTQRQMQAHLLILSHVLLARLRQTPYFAVFQYGLGEIDLRQDSPPSSPTLIVHELGSIFNGFACNLS